MDDRQAIPCQDPRGPGRLSGKDAVGVHVHAGDAPPGRPLETSGRATREHGKLLHPSSSHLSCNPLTFPPNQVHRLLTNRDVTTTNDLARSSQKESTTMRV